MLFFKGKINILLLIFSLLVLFASLSLGRFAEDQELQQCQHQCKQQRQFDSKDRHECERACERYIKEKERREKEHDQERERRSRDEIVGRREEEEEEEEEQVGGESGAPYVFDEQHFETKFREQEGYVRVLKRFSKRSRLLEGIENYRVLIFAANPQTFVVPNHWDADVVLFVAQGEGTVSLVYTDRRESFNVERGHVMVIPAGVTAYLVNRGNNEKLVIVKLLNPVSNPTGKFETFFGAGGQNPQSFLNAFSTEILEAAYKTSGDRLKRIFSQQSEGAIIRASEEQISALTHEKSSHWPFGGKSLRDSGPIQLFRKDPKESNAFGTLFETDFDDRRLGQQLQNLDIAVAFANITQGSMHTPYYNSRATKIAVVTSGRGRFQMACPHVSKSGHSRRHEQHQHHQYHDGKTWRGDESTTPVHYERITAELREGTVFVVPPGHPFVTLASEDQNLEVVCFEINAEKNHKFALAGQRNIFKNFKREAKELAFASSAEEVERVFESQDEEFFFPGPRQRGGRRGYYSII
ncbi:vicilin Cor a 11.0101-like [Amaranthus tricolor]|uniref:vicilin Cor a 11.0101-like n=1 Tax=Amaranthus tricolor TaxID=29722 RepID=UPI00258BA6BD|nr:vicilin Cor a 11.0101-like [Amaranthus tricolor]